MPNEVVLDRAAQITTPLIIILIVIGSIGALRRAVRRQPHHQSHPNISRRHCPTAQGELDAR